MKANKKKVSSGISGGAIIHSRQHEMVGVVFLLTATIIMLSLASFSPGDPVFEGAGQKSTNLIGLVGAYLAEGLLSALGISSFLLVAALVYSAVVAFSQGGIPLSNRKLFTYLGLTVLGTVMSHLAFSGRPLMGHPPGGVVGEYAGGLFVTLFSTIGSFVIIGTAMLLFVIDLTGFSPARLICSFWGLLCKIGNHIKRGIVYLSSHSWRAIANGTRFCGTVLVKEGREMIASFRSQPVESKCPKAKKSDKILAPPITIPPAQERKEPLVVTSEPEAADQIEDTIEEARAAIKGSIQKSLDEDLKEGPREFGRSSKKSFNQINRQQEPEIVIPRHKKANTTVEPKEPKKVKTTLDYNDYDLPKVSYLDYVEQTQATIDKETLHEYAKRLEQKLADYGVKGRVTKIMPGPVVTMYEYAPAPGIKVSKIAGLSNDLALALEALSVRIIAPIPGRAVVGIEVANKKRQTVFSKEIIGHETFQNSKSKLTLAFGKDIEGSPYITDLNKMPHLLVAGATGTGKSVALNTMIASILYRATPEDVRFIMVDPKVLELSLYDGIPHLLLPVVTDPRKAQAALYWAVNEMERRIQILHEMGVRSLDNYNKKVEKLAGAKEDKKEQAKLKKKVIVIDKTSQEVDKSEALEAERENTPEEPKYEKLPHIVIVIDELADLMMTSSREVETAIARIAQKARAAGIHLIIATQRPSVNVITGLIKANLPARVSFRVASKTDSRTILDQNGAETLLGNGDMLFHPPTTSEVVRIHGALITEDEITKVVDHLKEQAKPVYDETILASAEEDENGEVIEEEDHDELYDSAVRLIAEMGQASTSMVQRKLRIGYNRAARIIERMEREGIVGPPDGSKPREVLIQDHPM
jgi:S-DNA-T family DNA segregation ATPase FtsK/SpoIIIE